MLRNLKSFLCRDGFLARSNIFELAIGLIVIFAFQSVLNKLIGDIVLPVVGALTGGLDFSDSFVRLSRGVTAMNLIDAKKQGAVLAYGEFLTTLINFIILLFVLTLVLRAGSVLANRSNSEAPAPQPPTD
jgi:large conductance mechanosensitive channel